ncbi:MAG: carboxypeptidase-like regulatory domain-containing protein [Gemmatimonadales bacterium]
MTLIRRLCLSTTTSILACVAPLAVQAQTIQGVLVSEATGEPVVGAEVTLLDALGQDVSAVRSDSAGMFEMDVEPGRFTFRVLRLGFAPTVTQALDVGGAVGTVRVTIELAAAEAVSADQPYTLAPVTVEARPIPRYLERFKRRRVEGLGDFVLRDEFIGAAVGDTRSFDIGAIPIDAIEAVETYSRPAQIPAEFNRTGSNCGVVALWTRSALGEEAPSRVEIGARYGATIAHGNLGWGRLGVHLVTPFIGPIEFYPAFHVIVNLPAGTGGSINQGWYAQLAARGWPLGDGAPWYLGGGLVARKQGQNSGGFVTDAEVEAAYTVFTGTALALGPARPFVELHVINLLTFSDLEGVLFSGIGFEF